MKTYPIVRLDGTIQAFEISSTWLTFRPIYKILRSVPGVADVKRKWFSDDRISFTFQGHPCVVNEPFGDNSRFWIGCAGQDLGLDMSPIHRAFQEYRGLLQWSWNLRHDG